MSGTVVPPGRRLPSGRAPPGSGGGDLEPGGDPGGERGDGNDACTTVSTFNGAKKKRGGGDTVFRSGAAIPKPVQTRVDDPKVLTVGRRVELQTSHFSITKNQSQHFLTLWSSRQESSSFAAAARRSRIYPDPDFCRVQALV